MKTRVPFAGGWKLTWLAVPLALVLSAGASAAPFPKAGDWGKKGLANVGDEPGASGEATLTDVEFVGTSWWDDYGCTDFYTGRLTVACQGLTPGATYSTPAGTLTPRTRGKVRAAGDVSFVVEHFLSWSGWIVVPYVVKVVRLDSDGFSVTVLEGRFHPPDY
jgi:hypothetical protein